MLFLVSLVTCGAAAVVASAGTAVSASFAGYPAGVALGCCRTCGRRKTPARLNLGKIEVPREQNRSDYDSPEQDAWLGTADIEAASAWPFLERSRLRRRCAFDVERRTRHTPCEVLEIAALARASCARALRRGARASRGGTDFRSHATRGRAPRPEVTATARRPRGAGGPSRSASESGAQAGCCCWGGGGGRRSGPPACAAAASAAAACAVDAAREKSRPIVRETPSFLSTAPSRMAPRPQACAVFDTSCCSEAAASMTRMEATTRAARHPQRPRASRTTTSDMKNNDAPSAQSDRGTSGGSGTGDADAARQQRGAERLVHGEARVDRRLRL